MVSIGSFTIGVSMALICSFILKHSKLNDSPPLEFTIIILFAYGTYCIAEISTMSGIVSLFFCGVVMAHYTMYNISTATQTSTSTAFRSFATLSETFVFAYLGIYAGISLESLDQNWSVLMILFALLFCFISRAANIFPFSLIANIRRRTKIPFKMQIAMWFAGLRGAIAFALALNVPRILYPNDPHPDTYVISTTLTIVFFTTLVCGGLTERVLSILGLRNQAQNDRAYIDADHENSISNQPLVNDRSDIRGIHRMWVNFDKKYLKKWFGGSAGDIQAECYNIHASDDFAVNMPSQNTLEHNLVNLELNHQQNENLNASLIQTNDSTNSNISGSTHSYLKNYSANLDHDNMDGI